jgi:ubiquinone biosynthesis protein UbiJ
MLLTALESTLNRNIAASSMARTLCAKLCGKSMRIELTGVPLQLQLRAQADSVQLTRVTEANEANERSADAILSGSPLGLLNLAGSKPESALRGGSVRIEGDAEVAQGFRALLQAAQPDFEEELSRVIGDVAAHQVGNTLRSVLGFGRRVGNTLLQNVGEYVQEEGRDTPTKTEAEEFNRDVDVLRDDVERFEAKLARLEQKASKKSP